MRRRTTAICGAFLVAAVGAGCTHEPPKGDDALGAGVARVTELVADAAAAAGPHDAVDPDPPIAESKPCRRLVAGYAAGKTGRRQAERLAILRMTAPEDQYSGRDRIVAHWTKLGYGIDHSEEDDHRFERTRATTPDGYQVMVTAFRDGGPELRQLTLYSVSPCLR
jgi:hypothetical protein